ncbi:hypothetical protein GCM10027418_28410 [Mariniluteicoccus endophyticus]
MTKDVTTTSTTTLMNRSELCEHRDHLLRRAGRSLEDLRAAADRYELDARERTLLDDIEGVEWLLRER